MPKVFAKHPGDVIRVGNFGEATDVAPVEVPEDVALELASHPGLVIETGTKAAAPRVARKAHTEEKEG